MSEGRMQSSAHPSQKRYPPELRERAMRLLFDRVEQSGESYGVIGRIASQLGVGTETLRKWVKQSEVDAGRRPG